MKSKSQAGKNADFDRCCHGSAGPAQCNSLSKQVVPQTVPIDVPMRWSGFLERGRPRPLNPPLMQTQLVLVWLKGEQDVLAVLD